MENSTLFTKVALFQYPWGTVLDKEYLFHKRVLFMTFFCEKNSTLHGKGYYFFQFLTYMLFMSLFCFSQNCLPFSEYGGIIVESMNLVDQYSHHLFQEYWMPYKNEVNIF